MPYSLKDFFNDKKNLELGKIEKETIYSKIHEEIKNWNKIADVIEWLTFQLSTKSKKIENMISSMKEYEKQVSST